MTPAVTFHYLGEPGELFDGFGSAVDTIRELLKLNLRDTTTKVLASVDPDTGERCLFREPARYFHRRTDVGDLARCKPASVPG